MITKELLSEVLGIVITKIHTTNKNYVSIENILDTSLCFDTSRQSSININIYELAHKCKEWSYNKGFDIYSDFNGADVCHIGSNYSVAPFNYNVTEPEAIFKAAQWVLDNKDSQ